MTWQEPLPTTQALVTGGARKSLDVMASHSRRKLVEYAVHSFSIYWQSEDCCLVITLHADGAESAERRAGLTLLTPAWAMLYDILTSHTREEAFSVHLTTVPT